MTFRLKKLTVKNFKLFKDLEIEINTENLILLDGPNGFGKSSFYDALELLFLGRVERYIELQDSTSFGQNKSKRYPLMFNDVEVENEEDEFFIQADLELTTGETLTLKRYAKTSKLMQLKKIENARFKLKLLVNNQEKTLENEIVELTRLLGENYQKNYGLFHYIEQEENTSLLKSKGTDKQSKIDHLFDVSKYREKINKLERVRKALLPLRNESKKRELEDLSNSINVIKQELPQQNAEAIEYQRLINSSEQLWDKKSLTFEAGTYADWISDHGDLESLIKLKESEVDFVNEKYNQSIRRTLSLLPKVLKPMLCFGHRLDNISAYKEDIVLHDAAVEYLTHLESNTIELIKSEHVYPKKVVLDKIGNKLEFNAFENKVNEIRDQAGSLGRLASSLSELISSRDRYLLDYKKHKEQLNSKNSTCPTCGFDWPNNEALVKQFTVQSEALSALLGGQEAAFKVNLNDFEKQFIEKIKAVCLQVKIEESSSIDYKKEICELKEVQISSLKQQIAEYARYEIDLSDLYGEKLNVNELVPIEQLEERVQALYKKVNSDVLNPKFDDLFKDVFNDDFDALKNIEIVNIKNKINHLKQKYSESRLKELGDREGHYKIEKEKFDSAMALNTELNNLIKIYNKNVNRYIESITKGIESLFHIYSGRLLQNGQNGLGVFIETDGKSVLFKETPSSEHDVIFSMSSGQLSSLVIAFTLSLNQKYAKNNLLLIDDPVQTMDEINITAFIDLLRHQFKDRQIFISTHEDHTSSYFRYKFGKAGLDHQRINFKDIQKEINKNEI